MPIPPSVPPDPRSEKPDPAAAARLALRAVLTGVSIDICASNLLGLGIRMLFAMQIGTSDMTPDQLNDALQNTPPPFSLVLLGGVLGALVSVAAGYACARIARRDEYRVGGVMAMASVLLSLVLDDGGAASLDLALLYVLCDIACTMLGVKYGAEFNRRREAPASNPADAPTP